MQFNGVNNQERSSEIMWSVDICRVQAHWIRQYVLSLLQGFASHLAVLEHGRVCLYPHPSLPFFSTDSSVCRCLASLAWGLMAGCHGFSSHGAQFYLGAGCAISGSPWTSQAPTSHNKRCSC